eukprot:GHVU01047045.1.p1 GENE.GHVU01047045.1~~GHVU01047045.1.p1  ORF type:complete len:115 (-),score=1.32 GHVU01047045.1:346-690(-)
MPGYSRIPEHRITRRVETFTFQNDWDCHIRSGRQVITRRVETFTFQNCLGLRHKQLWHKQLWHKQLWQKQINFVESFSISFSNECGPAPQDAGAGGVPAWDSQEWESDRDDVKV